MQQSKLFHFQEKWQRIAVSTDPVDAGAAIEGIKQFAEAWGVKAYIGKFYKNNAPAWGRQHAGFHHTEFGSFKELEKFSAIHRSEWSMRCYLTRAFLPDVIRVVEGNLKPSIARPPGLHHLAPPQKLGANIRYIQYGQDDAHWLAVADFFATVFEDEHCKKWAGLIKAVSSVGLIWIRPHQVFFCDRPEIAKYDDHGRPHCEDGPALKYGDGYAYYAIHGVPVPEQFIVTPADQIDFRDVLKEQNAAVRMAVIQKLGFRRLMDTVLNRVISKASGNSLIEFTVRLAESDHWNGTMRIRALHLKWTDKTGDRETFLPVPRLAGQFGEDCPESVDDCEQVRRWTLGWPKEALAMAET